MVAPGAVCVFCGSSDPADPRYRDAARALGVLAARRGVDLVYGGGSSGLMGELANAALSHGGRVIGVIPERLWAPELNHTGLTELHQVGSMHERKQRMYDLSDAFVALPGGLGTLDELAEIATWAHLGLHSKPIALLDVDGFWESFVILLDQMVRTGLLRPASRDLIQRTRSAEEALAVLAPVKPRPLGGRDQRRGGLAALPRVLRHATGPADAVRGDEIHGSSLLARSSCVGRKLPPRQMSVSSKSSDSYEIGAWMGVLLVIARTASKYPFSCCYVRTRHRPNTDELFSSLLVPGQCHGCGADVGLTDVPAWTFCQPCARTGGDLRALRHAAAA